MKTRGTLLAAGLTGAAAWVLLGGLGALTAGSPDALPPQDLLFVVALLATPAAVSAALLWRAWWRTTGVRLAALDGPARLLALAAAAAPVDRAGWVAAMAAELTQVPDRAQRWRFAAGCARTAVFSPRAGHLPVLAAAAGAVVAVAAVAVGVGRALPALRLFAVVLTALAGALAVLAVARSGRPVRPAAGPLVAGLGLAGVAGCVAVTAYLLALHPSAAVALRPIQAAVLVLILAGGVWLTAAPPRALAADVVARPVGAAAALSYAAGLILVARTRESHGGIADYVIFGPTVLFFVLAVLTAAVAGSFGAGLRTVAWTAVLGVPFTFVVYLVEGARWHAMDRALLLDGDAGIGVGTNLADAIFWVLTVVPAWCVPFGVLGAALGAHLRRGFRRSRPAPPALVDGLILL